MYNLYRSLRCATLMVMMLAWMIPAKAQPSITLTTAQDVTDGTETLYWIESKGATGFYMIPHSDNSSVSTTNMPNLKALWYFMDAGTENNTQYYYVVNHNTGYYLKLDGTLGGDGSIKIASFGSGGDAFKFSIGGSEGQWVLYPKSGNGNYWVNKKSSNVPYDKYLKSSDYGSSPDANSKWNFVAKNSVTWAHPFTNSTNEVKHYYKIHNATSNGTAFYMSTDDASDPYATVSNVDNHKRIWYFMEAASDNTIPNLKYYYIVNAVTGKYLKFTGTANGNTQASSLQLYEHTGNETGDTEDRFQFMVLNAIGTTYSAYSIMPKLEISYYDNKNASLSPSNTYSNPLSNDMKIGIYNDRGTDNNYAHWLFVETEYVAVAVATPTVTNNYDGTITLSTTTEGATIYYTTNGVDPDNTSTEYSEPFLLGDATVIKAVAYLGTDFAIAPPYIVPTYTTPTISFDNNTSQITITSAGTVYYNTGDGSQDDPTPSSGTLYSAPFIVSSDITVKAIATHAGYLNSDVATWSNAQHDYSQDYLTFNVITAGTIPWKSVGSEMAKEIFYRINGGSWTPITAGSDVAISVNAGDVVEFKGNNEKYAKDKSNYSAFYEGTATYNAEGNIMSLIYGNNFLGQTTLTAAWALSNVFNHSNLVSAENLIMPATTLTNDCYRATFANSPLLTTAPALPATTLATECYYYMFDNCVSLIAAPELLATTLVSKCYYGMFHGCSSLNYIKCLVTNPNTTHTSSWADGVAATGTFVKDDNTTSWSTGVSGIPSGWVVNNFSAPEDPEITCDGEYITITCNTEGASIYYRLNQTGNFSSYSSPIVFNSTTTVEAYSTKDNNTSNTVIITFEKYDNPFDESTRSLDTWTYGNTRVILPYSVNGIDGHSSSYSKGNHTFETTITLYKVQPTYLWFQHADQSAEIYVDNTLVTTHWGGYNAFFVDISNYVHVGTNRIKVILNNTTRNALAPADGDFNFNATLGKVKLLTSPIMPNEFYGYDGFHITSSVTDASATINIKTSIPVGANVICKIDAEDGSYHFTDTKPSTGNEITFTTTISNPHLWNGIKDPFLYDVTIEIYDIEHNELYHRFQRPYGFRYYAYNTSTGFLLNGKAYPLRGVCMHHDLEGKANALNDDDIANDFAIIQELGCNFVRLAHYPHPKEVYDWCDRLGIIVQTEVPCVNKFNSSESGENPWPEAYYEHLAIQYDDMVKQHYNHPCIMFWGLANEITTNDKTWAKTKLEAFKTRIKALDPERWVGYVVAQGSSNPSSQFNDPDMDWFGCNIYVGWYKNNGYTVNEPLSNDPTTQLNTRITNIITNLSKPLAFSEYGCGGTQHCHSEDPWTTTTRGTTTSNFISFRHDIEYLMWLHEGHIAAIKEKPQLLFTSQWQLFDIAVSKRNEGYTICLDGVNTSTDDNLRYLNNKGLVERDHKTKKDPFYLYKAWWNPTDKFVHICGKDYEKLTDRVIKCYTNDTTNNCTVLSLYVNGVFIETAQVDNNIATFTVRTFNSSDVIRVEGATTHDAFTFTNDFITEGNWNEAANWRSNAVPADGSDAVIRAECTIPNGVVVHANNITIGENGSITIADGGQLVSNSAVNATVEKNITAYTVIQNQGESLTNGWYFIASPITDDYTPTGSMVENTYDLYRLNPTTARWENYKNTTDHPDFTTLNNGEGYLYANSAQTTLSFTGTLKPYAASESVNVSTGWNLIGNPFAYNVYANRSFYKMNEAKTGVEAVSAFSTSPIAPCTGIVVEAETNGDVIFSKEAPTQSQGNNGSLQIALNQANTRNNALLDNAIVSFNEGDQLGKFYFGAQNANIYIPQDAEEYAIVSVGRDAPWHVSTMDVNFKAKENGTYTITVNPENVKMGYLHLIDNITGTDVDLLQMPEYAFNAKTTDYACRFKLVFVCGNANDNNETFAFINNGNIIITADVEGATLQVIDVMGRVILSRDAMHCLSTSGFVPGMYVLRLINGDDVMTQKIVIR